MFDTETTEVSASESVETPAENAEPSWWIDENLPGAGDRPEWMPEKFKSVADMSKSYSELEKRFGSAPKEYDLSKAEGWLESEEAIKSITEAAREKGVPQEFMDTVLENIGEQVKAGQIDPEAEKAKLGDNADEMLKTLNNWATSNLSEDAYKALTKHMNTADAVMALNELRSKMLDSQPKVPTDNEPGKAGESVQDIQNEIADNYEKFKNDSAYRNEIQNRMERVADKSEYDAK